MNVVTLVPYRPTDGAIGLRHRWLWDQTRPALEGLGFPLFIGEPRGAAWARAEACNVAAERAGDWDIALVADCDTIPDPGAIRRAIAWVQDTGGAARPHDERTMLNQKGTVVFCQRGPDAIDRTAHTERSHAGGGLLVVTREAWDKVGGYNEEFKGWGYEDSDFNFRLLRHSTWDRLPGRAYHLWHPRDENRPRRESKEAHRRNKLEFAEDIKEWGADKGLMKPSAVL